MPETLVFDHWFFERYPYAIIDAGWREEIPDSWAASPIAPDFLKNDTARCPLLVDFSALPDTSRNQLLDRLEAETAAGAETLVSLALASSKPFQRLLIHLKQRLVIRPTAGEPRQFRYFDPGIFIRLHDVLGDPGMTWLLGPVDAVAVSWLGEWRTYRNPLDENSLRFNLRDHIDDLQAFSVINRVLAQLPDMRNQADWQKKGRTTRHIVDYAQNTYALTVRDDLIAFALHAWQWHPAFDRHPALQELLVELAAAKPEDELDYRELTARLDEADWQKIAGEMQAKETSEGKNQ